MAFSELLERAGGVGRFQVLQMGIMALLSLFLPSHMLLENFSAATPAHRCWVPLLDNGSTQASVPGSPGPEALLAVSIPPGPDRQPHRCRRFRHPQWQLLSPNASAANWSEASTEPCVDGWVYDRSTFTSTVVTQWDLVCDSQALKPMAQSIFLAGVLVGSALWGLLSSRLGRKRILSWSCLQMAVCSTSVTFAPNFLLYCGLRFLAALGVSGIILTTSALMVEWTTTGRRASTMTVQGCAFSVGSLALAGLSFALRDWHALQLAVSAPYYALFLACWWLPESARWLIIMGKPDQGLRELKRVARINGHKEAQKTLTIEVLTASMEDELAAAKNRPSQLALLRVPVLRRRTCVLMFSGFSLLISYYGLVLDLQSLGSNVYLLQVLFGAVDLLGRYCTPFLLRCFGRRSLSTSSQFLSGLSILGNTLVPQDLQALRVAFAVLGKGCFAVTLMTMAIYNMELFPTSVRLMASGVLQSTARLGAMLGPLLRMARQDLPLLPPLVYSLMPVANSLVLRLLLTETQGLPLPDTIQDLESQRSGPAQGHRGEVAITESTWL
ncbi:solute carrier family 22 member 11 [Dasypus novemcinctus]|uniref:solute carrier family 22 member 11 n=1 Tax=Dasypus novemcinctus TaxID=9361 RepID=UPI00265F4093|nr:solute carrier family 22 member 11 [Dasypus novemcinctus]